LDKFVIDQAEGLRRLLAREGSRVVAVTGGPGAPGRTTTVVNLAAALTAQGKDVLVIDECPGAQSVCAMLGTVRGAANFAAVMRGDADLAEAARHPSLGFGLLVVSPENRAQYTGEQLQKLLAGPADVVLIDTQLDADGALSSLAMHAHDVLVVMRVAAQSITETYACLKRLHFAHAIRQFRVLANYVADVADAEAALENLVGVASRYLNVALESAGCVAADPHMARAQQLGRCIVDAFPSTSAARDYRRLADDLPYWPMRPALSSRLPGVARLAVAGDAVDEDTFVSTVAGDQTEDAPAHAGWRADLPARRTTQHA
jgi:flagellar biosynthesis protein FlhG